jgi:hypothetical protein
MPTTGEHASLGTCMSRQHQPASRTRGAATGTNMSRHRLWQTMMSRRESKAWTVLSKKRGNAAQTKALLGLHQSEAFALLTMAAQINPNNEVQSPSSPKVAQLHARLSIDEPAEDRDNGHEEAWSDDEAEEEGPKRKRPRPLSAS